MEGVSMTRLWIRLLARNNDESGQATVEYFLVILAATALAIIALKWLQSGSGGGLLGSLFGKVIGWVVGKF
jgi:Flp pilus assembly pilin Flp